jgi:hypothetical protein
LPAQHETTLVVQHTSVPDEDAGVIDAGWDDYAAYPQLVSLLLRPSATRHVPLSAQASR